MTNTPEKQIQNILTFWFEETTAAQKFTKDPDFDAKIVEMFGNVYEDIVAGNTTNWRDTPEGRLAEIIVLDQFSRNMFRGDAKSFAADTLALTLAMDAVAVGADQELSEDQRKFLYMPYMHSESSEVHTKAVQLFTYLGNETSLKYEISHKKIIDTFGRYPHRNAVLGRESTAEEIEFLKEHGGF